MSLIKLLKTIIRKWVINPMGFDLVPFRKTLQSSPEKASKHTTQNMVDDDHVGKYVALFGEEAVREKRFYNLGAGPSFKHSAWTVINHPSVHYGDDYMDIKWDLLSGESLPIEDNQARIIFSRYTLEHVSDEAVNHFLRESFRAMIKGGTIRLIVPDIDIFYLAYLAKMPDLFFRANQDNEVFPNKKFQSNPNQASLEQRFLWTFASNSSELHPDGAPERISDEEFERIFRNLKYDEALNYCTSKCSLDVQRRYPENHINWFNSKKLESMLLAAGFNNVYQSQFGKSKCIVLREVNRFENRRPEIGLYIEAVK